MVHRYWGAAALALLLAGPVLAAEAKPDSYHDLKPNPDPWERFNRRVFAFNDKVDRHVLKPVAKGYRKITPQFLDDGITNLLNNLSEPVTIVNDALQGKLLQSVQDTGRFVVNSTVGLAGFFDVARHVNLPRHEEDFGQTFAKWGVPAGPYVVVPFFFGMTIRDGAGYGTEAVLISDLYNRALNFDWEEKAAILGLRIVDTRADLISMEDSLQVTGDRYVLLRDAWFQHRAFLINDGVVEDDPFLDDDESMDEGTVEPQGNAPAEDSGAMEEGTAPADETTGDSPIEDDAPGTGAPVPATPDADTIAASDAR